MADEVKPDNQVEKEGGSPNPDQVTIDRAELESLKTKGVTLDEIAAIAKENDYEDPKEYLNDLGTEAQRLYNESEAAKKQEPKPEVKPEIKPEVQQSGLTEEDKKAMQANDLRSTQAFLQSQKVEFKLSQMQLPEDKRSNITDSDLLKVIRDPNLQPMVKQLAGKFDGNVFAAAAHYLKVEEGMKTAHEEGAASQAAIEAAVGSASLGTGGKVPEVTNKTVEEKAAEANKQAADDIAPDDVP